MSGKGLDKNGFALFTRDCDGAKFVFKSFMGLKGKREIYLIEQVREPEKVDRFRGLVIKWVGSGEECHLLTENLQKVFTAAVEQAREEFSAKIENHHKEALAWNREQLSRIDKLEARIATLEAAKIWPPAYPGVSLTDQIGGACPNCGFSIAACKCPALKTTCTSGLTVGENVAPLTAGAKK